MIMDLNKYVGTTRRYTHSGFDEHLPDLLGINGVQCCIFGGSGYIDVGP